MEESNFHHSTSFLSFFDNKIVIYVMGEKSDSRRQVKSKVCYMMIDNDLAPPRFFYYVQEYRGLNTVEQSGFKSQLFFRQSGQDQ